MTAPLPPPVILDKFCNSKNYRKVLVGDPQWTPQLEPKEPRGYMAHPLVGATSKWSHARTSQNKRGRGAGSMHIPGASVICERRRERPAPATGASLRGFGCGAGAASTCHLAGGACPAVCRPVEANPYGAGFLHQLHPLPRCAGKGRVMTVP